MEGGHLMLERYSHSYMLGQQQRGGGGGGGGGLRQEQQQQQQDWQGDSVGMRYVFCPSFPPSLPPSPPPL